MHLSLWAKILVPVALVGSGLAIATLSPGLQSSQEPPTMSPSNSAPAMADSDASPCLQLPATQRVAQAFEVSIGMDIPPSTTAGPTSYGELLRQGELSEVELITIEQADAMLYVFQVSEARGDGCPLNAACAAPARGNVAVVEVPLPKGRLAPGTYRIVAPGQGGSGQAIAADQVTISMGPLSADPIHAQLSCQSWGSGEFRIEEAVYGADGVLTALTASLSQTCAQARPIPSDPPLPSTAMPSAGTPSAAIASQPETYQVRFSWQLSF